MSLHCSRVCLLTMLRYASTIVSHTTDIPVPITDARVVFMWLDDMPRAYWYKRRRRSTIDDFTCIEAVI